jgi:NADP-dependent aldehyde dehydrogenase
MSYKDFTVGEIDGVMEDAWSAFHEYRKFSLKQRAEFMHAIAVGLENNSAELISTAMSETNLPEARLRGELSRTIFQLNSYGDAAVKGQWLEARIDTAIPDKTPPKPDIRKMLVPLGPVVVFGASNFPFAYSTAGGDTACAFAAGCPVIVKAHPAHVETSTLVARVIEKVAIDTNLPKGIFTHVYGMSNDTGKALVMHPFTKAVGFTGSYSGGKQLFDWGSQRKEPIPVFSEMGSVNPVFLLPAKMKTDAASIAKNYASSITLGVGQFCTNPGLIIGIEGEDLKLFESTLAAEMKTVPPAKMLHEGIAKAFKEKKEAALSQTGVSILTNNEAATLASASGKTFLSNPILHQEVFGPYSIIIHCADLNEMLEVAKKLEGQLTASLMATENDIKQNSALVEAIKNICGRLVMNGVPTGVEVCLSMHHGGPFPATTDPRFTSVGADGIKRFARPIAYQNWPNELLPEELKDENALGIWRTVNNEVTNTEIKK